MENVDRITTNFTKTKRKRAANYSAKEKAVLLNLILKEKHIIESKKTDAKTWREKEICWKRIAANFNARSPSLTYRSVESLKKFFDNHKKLIKKGVVCGNSNSEGLIMSEYNPEKLTVKTENSGAYEHYNCGYNTNEHEMNSENDGENDQEAETNQEQQANDENIENTPKPITCLCRKYSVDLQNSSNVSEHSSISDVKLEMAKIELNSFRESILVKKEREKVEFDLRIESLQLDLEIKKEILKKIRLSEPNDCVKTFINNSIYAATNNM